MSTITESVTEARGVGFSAEAAGAHGALRCHVTRIDDEHSARFAVSVCNESGAEAHALAFVFFDAPGERRRTIVQTIIGPHADFSTTVMLDLTATGQIPEVHLALSNGDTEFTLVVPRTHVERPRPDARIIDEAHPLLAAPKDTSTSESAAAAQTDAQAAASGPAGSALALLAEPAPLAHQRRGTDVRPEPRRLAPLPPSGESSPPIVPIVVLFAALIALAAYLIARPQIPQLLVPATALPGAPLSITYRATGVGSADYVVFGPDGLPIARGPLVVGSGLFRVDLPAAPSAQAYLVRVRVANLLGNVTAEDYVRVPAAPAPAAAAPAQRLAAVPAAPPPPQIHSLAVDRATVGGGEKLTVYYDVAGDGGSIVLLDPAARITYGRQPISAAGHSTFVAPHVDATRLLTVLATVRRGKAVVESRIGVTVTPPATGDDGAPAADTGLAPLMDDAAPTGRPSAGSSALTAPARVRSGEPVWVDLRGTNGDVEITLLDNSGRELDRRELAPGKHSVEFTAPEVGEPTRLVFEATVPQGVGTVTLVRAISVTP